MKIEIISYVFMEPDWRHWHRTWVPHEIEGRSQSKQWGGVKGLAQVSVTTPTDWSQNDYYYEWARISLWIILQRQQRFRYHLVIANLFVGDLKWMDSIVHRRISATIAVAECSHIKMRNRYLSRTSDWMLNKRGESSLAQPMSLFLYQ